ncbi:hypothetical protein EXIGLDRAFT_747308 [Exidia glandulosa HHB12029]|uniref:Uncharacterized protein n=1 Tax=Exidia glandulosa HHB12029 TaxID=1314781 RepID=A0A165KXI6_EXIGL|nr:hypothetical protein EXIGLDRAFT_747308 [Exidia glandulosa HHB12029]
MPDSDSSRFPYATLDSCAKSLITTLGDRFYALKAPRKYMRLGWKLSEDEIFDIVDPDAHAARDLVDRVRKKWADRDGEYGDSPYIGVSEDRGYYILIVHLRALFKREFIERHVRAVRECLHIPDSLDNTFGWHMTR